jgi:3'-phosphoadenosine 5'-phosphosulfate sulfotransferase (PAPS reductase)/FAD synthetase
MSERHIVHFSGGKDSTVMLLKMIDTGIRIDEIAFCDTLLEYDEQYKYIDKISGMINKPILKIKPDTTFFKWFYGEWTDGKYKGQIRGFPMISCHGYCCRELKVKPSNKLYGKEGKHFLGYGYDERNRVQQGNFAYPLIDLKLTEDYCSWYLKKLNLVNPIYKYQNRTGCWLCPKQSKDSLWRTWYFDRRKYNCMVQLEKVSPHGFHPRYKLSDLSTFWGSQTYLEPPIMEIE